MKTPRMKASDFKKVAAKRKKPSHKEDDLQISCVRYFDSKIQPKNPHLKLFAVPNGGKRNVIEAAKFKRMGVRAGIADLVLLNGYFDIVPETIFIELKTEKGKHSDNQKEFETWCCKFGYRYITVRSLDDFIALISLFTRK